MDDEKISRAYQTAIQARNFHYDNYNKWMTFYYVAIGAILIAFYTDQSNKHKILLSIMGMLISIFWYLSCKGYYLWVKHWIDVIFRIESMMKKNEQVYSIFSKACLKKSSLWNPVEHANISTSKLTLLFSFASGTAWAFILLDDSNLPLYLHLLLSVGVPYILGISIGVLLKSDLRRHWKFQE